MSMEIFKLSNGQIVQIISKKRIEEWEPEVPLMFIDYIMEKKLSSYGTSKDQAKIKKYLEGILEEVAIPKLSGALESDDTEARLKVSGRLVEVAKKNPDKVKGILKFLEKIRVIEQDKKVKKNIETVLKKYTQAQKRKEYAAKRKKMQELDKKLLSGDITAAQYTKERKEYLQLGQDVGDEE
ncbi:MAG: hypothetical protein ACTSUE_22435 [Promethearchaeota archaeon]